MRAMWLTRHMPHELVVPDPDVEAVLERLGREVVMGRGRLGGSQAWLAAATGLSQPTISRLEAGCASGLRLERYARVVAVIETGHPVADWDPAVVLERQGLERRLRRERRLAEILEGRRAATGRPRRAARFTLPWRDDEDQPGE